MKVKEKLQSNLFTEEVLGKTFYGKSDGTFLEEHIKEVMDNFQNFLELYPNKFTFREQELIMKACQYHDYGKVNTLFQEFMKTGKKSSKWLQHGFFSPCFLNDRDFLNESEYEAFVTAIFYHHPRECPYFNPEKNTFIEDYKKYVKENGEKFIKKEMKNRFDLSELLFEYPNYSGIRYSILKDKENIQWILYSKIKGMLNRCDYSASAGSKTIEESPLENEKIVADIILEHYSNLRKSQEFALEHKDENIVLIAPTGSGKTEAALLWIGKEKGFYTLPLKVASTAIYHRIKDKKNYHYSKVSLLHSDALDALIDETNSKEDNTIKERYEDYQRMKRLSYPLTICTVDQIFKFPFKSLGQEQFLATLSYSKVVIDEIQMYSSRILACLLVGLSMLIKAGGKFMIITATFPDFFAHLLKEEVGVNHYIVKNCANDDTLLRHKIQFLDHDFDYEKIVESAKLKKVLVICNTISKAIDVYRNLKELNESVTKGLLHSHFIKKDRSELETRILEFKENGIWVTSPIVEASLDIDFDELYTEMCSADSLLQRFGRCYRKRAYDKKIPIFIYMKPTMLIYMIKKYTNVLLISCNIIKEIYYQKKIKLHI